MKEVVKDMKNIKLENQQLLVEESLLSTGNGYIGVRGNFEEGYPSSYQTIRGTYINGFYDIVDILYGENAYGFPQTAQKMLNVADAQTMIITIEGIPFDLFTGELLAYERQLDIQAGLAIRKIRWRSNQGHELEIEIRRMTSFNQLELFLIDYQVKALNFEGTVAFKTILEGNVENYTNANDPRVASGHAKLLTIEKMQVNENSGCLTLRTSRAGTHTTTAFGHNLPFKYERLGTQIQGSYECYLERGEFINVTQYVIYTDSIRHEDTEKMAFNGLALARSKSANDWFKDQKAYMDEFWKYASVSIEGEEGMTETIRYSLYQLLASAGKDSHSNICAKGLSGEGYEGHYFWDTEIYMMPFFILTQPEIAKNLLKFRHGILPQAKEIAKDMGHKKGAKIPWRTISGTECSGYFPAGSAQYHINADVAYAYIQYYLYSQDLELMREVGFEVLVETARIWLDMGHYLQHGEHVGAFAINNVTGPDEYTAIVNNNYYTNAMAKYHLHWTYELSQRLKEDDYASYEALSLKLELDDEEMNKMKQAANTMYLPYSKELDIHLQDDSFLAKATWDFEHTPKEKHPLLLHYHPLTIYRYQVLKQADTVLAHFLLDDAEASTMENSYHFYEKLTTHDSSLSPCVHSMMAARINHPDLAYKYFKETVRLDLDNLHNNTKDGLHIANAGGVYMSLVYGFAGLRIKADGLHLRPTLPKEWTSISFNLRYLGGLVKIHIDEVIRIECEKPMRIFIDDERYDVNQYLEVRYHGKH